MSQRVVINKCYGGFGLSRQAFLRLRELGNKCALAETDIGEFWPGTKRKRSKAYDSFCSEIERSDPQLLQVIDELGANVCSSDLAELKVVDVPDDIKWYIDEYDGKEWVAEEHETWG